MSYPIVPESLPAFRRRCAAAVAAAVLLAGAAAHAADAEPESAAVHGQLTNVTQWHPAFSSPYAGPNSLDANGRTEETTDLTLYAGHALWRGAEAWVNAEIDQGFGLSNTLGVAGFPSGEAYKVGANTPYVRLPRAFVRQTIDLGGAAGPVERAPNQLGGVAASDKLVLTLGKFSAVDLFDTNSYAHDPRSDFLNWAVIDGGAFDYAADAWGYTYGAAAEWSRSWWTLRGGVFQLSSVPNGKVVRVDFNQRMAVVEWEVRHEFGGQPGKVRLLAFSNRGRMASYRDALQLGQQLGVAPDVVPVRRRASRSGAVINVEQQLGEGMGLFARASANDGSKEAFEFTEINRSLSAGVNVEGARWGRAGDHAGAAFALNGLSDAARAYFGAGGQGILIGDGRLDYGREMIGEWFYSLAMGHSLALTTDYQRIVHPAYNRDRGPVSVWSLRLHGEF